MLTDTGNNATHKELKDMIDEKKMAELTISPDAQEAFFWKERDPREIQGHPLNY